MSSSINLFTPGRRLAKGYAQLQSKQSGDAVNRAPCEKIEDEYDIAAAKEAHDEYVKSGGKSRPIEALWRELGL